MHCIWTALRPDGAACVHIHAYYIVQIGKHCSSNSSATTTEKLQYILHSPLFRQASCLWNWQQGKPSHSTHSEQKFFHFLSLSLALALNAFNCEPTDEASFLPTWEKKMRTKVEKPMSTLVNRRRGKREAAITLWKTSWISVSKMVKLNTSWNGEDIPIRKTAGSQFVICIVANCWNNLKQHCCVISVSKLNLTWSDYLI